MTRKQRESELDSQSVTLYSPVFLGTLTPKRLRVHRHITAWIIQEMLLGGMVDGSVTEETDPPPLITE